MTIENLVTLKMMRERVTNAECIAANFGGNRVGNGGVELARVGEYVVVNDDQGHWVVLWDSYAESLAYIVNDILKGAYDNGDQFDYGWLSSAYGDFCCMLSDDVVYTSLNSSHDVNNIRDLDISDDDKQEIIELLGLAN